MSLTVDDLRKENWRTTVELSQHHTVRDSVVIPAELRSLPSSVGFETGRKGKKGKRFSSRNLLNLVA